MKKRKIDEVKESVNKNTSEVTTKEEAMTKIDRALIIKEIMTNKKFRFLPGKAMIIKNLNKMSDEQIRALVGDAFIKATQKK